MYEYLLETWGGFYTFKNQLQHGRTPGYFWFASAVARQEYLDKLKNISKEISGGIIEYRFEEGEHTRERTIAKMVFEYNGKKYSLEDDLGLGYSAEAAAFIWEEGNYSCDCNRSIHLGAVYAEITELPCGDTIDLLSIEIEHRTV